MSCLEVSYSSGIPLSDYSQRQTDPRTKISIFSLLNPEPAQAFAERTDIPSAALQDHRHSVHSYQECSSVYERSGYERKGHTRRISQSFRKSPYPAQHERVRRARRTSVRLAGCLDIAVDKRTRKPSRSARISLDSHLYNADLEEEARRCRAEWLKDQISRVEAPRPPQHSQPEVEALTLWLAHVLCHTFLDEQAGSGRTHVLKEIGAEIRSLLSSCINPPTSIVFLALFYVKKLFPDRFQLHEYRDLHRAQFVFRAFCLGLMFSFKWLDDYTHCIGSNVPETNQEFWRRKRANPKKYRTCWADFMNMSVSEIRYAEVCALTVLDWNISVSTSDWFFWLENLRILTVAHSQTSAHTIVAGLISSAQLQLRRNSPDAPFLSPARQRVSTGSRESLRRLECALLVGIPIVPQSWTVPLSILSPVSITHTAELRRFEDEIVHRPTVLVGCAPGQSESQSPTYRLSNSEGCSPLSRSPDCRTTDLVLAKAQISQPSYTSAMTPIFLNPWHVYDFKSSVYL